MAARGGVCRQQADEDHGRAYEGAEGDEEVLGDDGDFVKDEEEEEIVAEEDAVDAADEGEEEGEEFVGAQIDVPTEEDSGHCGKTGEEDEDAAYSIRRKQEVDAHGGNPGQVDDYGSSLVPAGDESLHAKREPANGKGQRQPAGQGWPAFGQQRQHQRSGKREIDCEG